MSQMNPKELIARRVAKELKDGYMVNLGIGLPTMVGDYLETDVTFQSENGLLGLGHKPEAGKEDMDLTNAGGQPVTLVSGGSYFDSAFSFALIRGGHVDATVLGALQVDEEGTLASWMIPGKMVPGMGGAMDLVTGAKRVIIAMRHTAKGNSKVLKKCTLPITAVGVVDMIVTELCVFKFIDGKLTLTELSDGVTLEDVKAVTEAEFEVRL